MAIKREKKLALYLSDREWQQLAAIAAHEETSPQDLLRSLIKQTYKVQNIRWRDLQ